MDLLNYSLFFLMVLGWLLSVFIRVIERRYGDDATNGVIIGIAFLEILVLVIGYTVGGSLTAATIGAGILLVWMIAVYITFLVVAIVDPFTDEDFPPSQCVPKKTFGKNIDFRDKQWPSFFTRFWVRFRCRPNDTLLHKSLRARKIRFWGLAFTTTTHVLRHNSEILCDAACKAGANHTGPVRKGSDVLLVQLYFTQIQVGSYIEIEVKMFAAMGATRVVITGGANLQASSGQTSGGSMQVAPGQGVSSSSTTGASGSVTVGSTVTFPDASSVIEFDAGFFQWQCVPPSVGEGVFRLDLPALTLIPNGNGGIPIEEEQEGQEEG